MSGPTLAGPRYRIAQISTIGLGQRQLSAQALYPVRRVTALRIGSSCCAAAAAGWSCLRSASSAGWFSSERSVPLVGLEGECPASNRVADRVLGRDLLLGLRKDLVHPLAR